MTIDRKKMRELAMAVLASASGKWTVRDTNEDDVQRPTRFAGPVVVYADDDCDIHPIADCSCNHTCRDGDQQRDIAAFIAAAHPGAILKMLDDLEKAERVASESKAGSVLDAVKRVLATQADWSVEDIKAGVARSGVRATSKQIYNALGHLTRRGEIMHAGYGQYVPA